LGEFQCDQKIGKIAKSLEKVAEIVTKPKNAIISTLEDQNIDAKLILKP